MVGGSQKADTAGKDKCRTRCRMDLGEKQGKERPIAANFAKKT
jgi:hypothetical protein